LVVALVVIDSILLGSRKRRLSVYKYVVILNVAVVGKKTITRRKIVKIRSDENIL